MLLPVPSVVLPAFTLPVHLSIPAQEIRPALTHTLFRWCRAFVVFRAFLSPVPVSTFLHRHGILHLTNAPAAFQRFMNDLFSDLLDVYVVVYLDDILVYSENPADHQKHVREVLRRLRAAGLYASLKKCVFDTDTVEFLGYIISPQGLSMDRSKVKVIQEWPEPRKVKDVQSFLGFANFYRRFIADYSDIVVPLTRLTRKSEAWVWSPECQKSFDALKKAFTTAPILSHWIPGAQLILESDASDYAIAAILSIVCTDGEIRPIAFHSRTLSG